MSDQPTPAVTDPNAEPEVPPIDQIGQEYELIQRRIRAKMLAAQAPSEEGKPPNTLDPVSLARLMLEVVQTLRDHAAHTHQLIEFSAWAEEEISTLTDALDVGDSPERASQLDESDALAYKNFFGRIRPVLEQHGDGDLIAELDALVDLTDDITLDSAADDPEEPADGATETEEPSPVLRAVQGGTYEPPAEPPPGAAPDGQAESS